MNAIRKDFVIKAFKKLDKDGSGMIDIKDIRGVYNAKNHPDVRAGKKTEEEALGEFLDTFEVHHSLKSKVSYRILIYSLNIFWQPYKV